MSRGVVMQRGEFEKLTKEERKRILLHADNLARKCARAGISSNDITHEAYKKIMEGKRQWDANQCTFLTFYLGVMSSIANNVMKLYCHHNQEYVDIDNLAVDNHHPSSMETFVKRYDYQLLFNEFLDFVEQRHNRLYPLAVLIFKENIDDTHTLSEMLEIKVEKLYNDKRVLKEIYKKKFG